MIDEVQRELSKLEIDAPVFLYKFDLVPIGAAETYYFSPQLLNGANILMGGQAYQYAAVHIGEIVQDGAGDATNSVTLTLTNKDRFASTLCTLHKDCVGAKITRIQTLRSFLDGQSLANPAAYIRRHVFIVDRKSALDDEYAQFELRSMSSITGKSIPKQVCLKNICTRTYRVWNGAAYIMGSCPYAGAAKFTRAGASTADPYLDQCSFDMKGCDLRYPDVVDGEPKPLWAFPGMQRV